MGGRSTNWSIDLGMMTNHKLSESTKQNPELSECTEHSSKPVTPTPYSCEAKQFYIKEPNHSTLQGYQGIINQSSSSSSFGARKLTPIMQFLYST
jgi:hypothetical protein